MSRPKANGRNLLQEARMVMHEDEHAIIKAILVKALGDDECFARVLSGNSSVSGRAGDRLVLGKFLVRMERQFALRAEARAEDQRDLDRLSDSVRARLRGEEHHVR